MSLPKKLSLIYKSILIFFFNVYYRKVKTENKNSVKIPSKQIKIDNFNFKIFRIKDCRLFTNTNDIAVIKENFVLEGPSLQIRNDINSKVDKNVVFKTGTPKIYKKINKRVFSLLTGVDSNHNYYHWFLDCLPKIFFYEKFYKYTKEDYFLVPNYFYNYQKESLQLLGIKNIINAYDLKHFKIKELITTSFTSFGENPPLSVLQLLRRKFLQKKFISSKKKKLKIFLNRSGKSSLHRDLINKKEIIEIFLSKGFKIIDPSKISLANQIKIFNSAKFIAGVHGASFTNTIFCRKNTKVLELIGYGAKNDTILNIAKKLNLNFYTLKSDKKVKKNNYFWKKIKYHNKRTWDGQISIIKKDLVKVLPRY